MTSIPKTATVSDSTEADESLRHPALVEGIVEIAGRRYAKPEALASLLGVTTRTLNRWDAARVGPPKIKVGKLVLFDLARLPEWLASCESAPVRLGRTGHR